MPKRLSQIVAVVKDQKREAEKQLTLIRNMFNQGGLFQGINRDYIALEEDGLQYEPERTIPRANATELLQSLPEIVGGYIDTSAAQDWANQEARASVVIDDKTILEDVPVSHLIFLDDTLKNLETVITTAPTLTPGVEWVYDDVVMGFKSPVNVSYKTRKDESFTVVVGATDKHPAQYEKVVKDTTIGRWNRMDTSTCLHPQYKQDVLTRIQKLRQATVEARQEANSSFADSKNVSKRIFDYLLAS